MIEEGKSDDQLSSCAQIGYISSKMKSTLRVFNTHQQSLSQTPEKKSNNTK